MKISYNTFKRIFGVWGRIIGVTLFFVLSSFLIATTLPPYVKIAPAFDLKDVPASIKSVKAPGDPIARNVKKIAPNLPGYSDLVVQPKRGRAFATAMDGWMWAIDLASGTSKRFVDIPLQGGGMRRDPTNPDILYFCSSLAWGRKFPKDQKVGIYQLRISTKKISPVLLRVPNPPRRWSPAAGNVGVPYATATAPGLRRRDMTSGNSRNVIYCNDLIVSRDGKRFYMTESLDHAPTGFGQGYAFRNFVTLGRRGRLWRLDRASDRVTLAGQGYNFADGVILEDLAGPEQSVLITENPRARILRLFLSGAKAGRDEIVMANLPGLSDGLSRDARGNIWSAQVGPRSGALAFVYRYPFLKYILARVPPGLVKGETQTGILQLSPDGKKPLYFTMHDGSVIRGISKVIPVSDGVYLSVSVQGIKGLYKLPLPK